VTASPPGTRTAVVACGRLAIGLLTALVVIYAYVLRLAVGDSNPFDYFGYFTNLTCLIASVVLIVTGALMLAGKSTPSSLQSARAVATSCILVVAVVYNTLVPGTGTAPVWVSTTLHIIFPCVLALDWLLVGDRSPQPWRKIWLVLPYPICWLLIVLLRGVTDGWVPYGFLLPERGLASLVIHIAGLLACLLLAGALVWGASRTSGLVLRTRPESATAGLDG